MLSLSKQIMRVLLVFCFCRPSYFVAQFSPFAYWGLTERELVPEAGEPDKKRTISMVDSCGAGAEYSRWEYYGRTLDRGFLYTMYYVMRDHKVFEIWRTALTGNRDYYN